MKIRIRYWKGTEEVPHFGDRFTYHDGMLKRFQALLEKQERQWVVKKGTSREPESEFESKAEHHGKRKRKDADGQRRTTARLTPSLQYVFRHDEEGSTKGRYYCISSSLSDNEKLGLLQNVLRAFEAEIAEVRIQLCDENGAPIEVDDPDSKGDVLVVLDELAMPPFMALGAQGLVPLWRRNVVDFNREDGRLHQWIRNKIAPDPFPPVPCLYDRESKSSYEAGLVSEIERCIPGWVKERYGLWIPDYLPDFFFDTRDATLYTPAGDRMRVGERVPSGKIACYGLSGEEISSRALTVPLAPYWPAWGRGGQGAMRCDRSSEFTCSVEDSGPLAAAFGLANADAKGDQVRTLELTYPWGNGDARLTYRKVYRIGGDRKKNAPRNTIPLTWPDVRKPVQLETFGLTKKRKGDKVDSSDSHRTGERTSHPQALRLAAAKVMKDSLQKRFAQAKEPDLGNWKGDATGLAELAFASDKRLATTWGLESANLRTLSGKPVDDDKLKARLRTDQEWCHLVGHGDGGPEIEANFVSGSKHCNTEQLALELAQREYRGRGIVVKVTAYLLTGRTWLNAARLTKVLKRFPSLAKLALDNPFKDRPNAPVEVVFMELRDKLEEAFRAEVRKFGQKQKERSVTLGDLTIAWPRSLNVDGLHHRAKVLAEETLNFIYDVMPVAYKMRYKVYVRNRHGRFVQAVDHVYHGQREEMDFNEFRFLQHAFRLMIARATESKDEIEAAEQQVTDMIAARNISDDD